MKRLDDHRRDAEQMEEYVFARFHPNPALIMRFVVVGELKHVAISADRGGGRTMLHVRGNAGMDLEAASVERIVDLRRREGNREHRWLAVGRLPECDVFINDYTVSASHGRFHTVPGLSRTLYEDAGSTNGSAHNGILLEPDEKVMLTNGDLICLGRMAFTYFDPRGLHRYLLGNFDWDRKIRPPP